MSGLWRFDENFFFLFEEKGIIREKSKRAIRSECTSILELIIFQTKLQTYIHELKSIEVNWIE